MRPGLALAAFVSVSALAQEGGNIALSVGTQKVMNLPGLQRVVVGDDSIADVKQADNQLLLTGRHVGKTTLLVWKMSGERQSWTISVGKGQKLHAEETPR